MDRRGINFTEDEFSFEEINYESGFESDNYDVEDPEEFDEWDEDDETSDYTFEDSPKLDDYDSWSDWYDDEYFDR